MAETKSDIPGAVITDTSGPTDTKPASDFSPSGAPQQVTDIPVDHPAIDNDPRANTTELMNRIDMNDPRPTEVVQAEAAESEAKSAKKA